MLPRSWKSRVSITDSCPLIDASRISPGVTLHGQFPQIFALNPSALSSKKPTKGLPVVAKALARQPTTNPTRDRVVSRASEFLEKSNLP